MWKQLSHPHVLPLYGTVNDFGPCISMICPWMENGSVSKYLERCGDIVSIQERLRIVSSEFSKAYSCGVLTAAAVALRLTRSQRGLHTVRFFSIPDLFNAHEALSTQFIYALLFTET